VATIRITHDGTDPQRQFWACKPRFTGFVGGRGSGKSYAGCLKVLQMPPGSIGLVAAPTYPMLRDATLKTFQGICNASTPSIIHSFNKADMEMRLVNGTTILWRSADNPDTLRGPTLDWFWFDEAAMMPKIAWDIAIGTLRGGGPAWATTTPRGYSWLYDLFLKKASSSYELVRASMRSNQFTTEEFKQSMEELYSGSWAKQELDGEFVEWADSPCYTSFRREINAYRPLQQFYNKRLPLILACDFNVRYMCWPIGQVIDGKPIVINEIVRRNPVDIESMVRDFRNLYPDHPGEVWVYGDASGHNRSVQTDKGSNYDLIKLYLKTYPSTVQFNVPRSNPAPTARINAVNRMLRGEQGVARLEIDPVGCPELILDLLQTEWAKSGTTELQVNKPDDPRSERSHATSGLGYWIAREWPIATEVAENESARPMKRPKCVESDLPGGL